MVTYIDTDEISVFGVVVRIDGTLCGLAKRNTWAPPGGGLEPEEKFDILATLKKELREELEGELKLELASEKLVMFYTNAKTKRPVFKAKPGQKLKLHIYMLLRETSGGIVADKSAELQQVDFRMAGFLRKEPLRPSFAHALKQFEALDLWPNPPQNDTPVRFDGHVVLETLLDMNFNPYKTGYIALAIHDKTYE